MSKQLIGRTLASSISDTFRILPVNLNYLRPLLKERMLKTMVVYDGSQENAGAENGIINFRHLQW